MIDSPTPKSEFFAGAKAVVPLLIGSIPFATIFGAVAVTSGLSPLAAAAMSAFVFAGSAQFVAVGMLAAGAGNLLIILTTLIINLRHLLYAATLAPHISKLSQRWLIPLGFTLTDESFVTSIQRYDQDDNSPFKHWFHLGTTLSLYVNWQIFTWVGLWAGSAIPNPAAWGLDFAFPATFIGMLVPLLVKRSIVACALSAGVASILFHNLPNHSGLFVAALCGVAAGIIVERLFPTTLQTQVDQLQQPGFEQANKP